MLSPAHDDRFVSLLRRWADGDESVQDQLFYHLSPVMVSLARQQLNQHGRMLSLESRDLANEASIRLIKLVNRPADELHLRRLIARVMRLTCVDLARERQSKKRSGQKVSLAFADNDAGPGLDLLELNDAIEQLDGKDPMAAQVTELRFFAGLSESEVADTLGVSRATVTRKWKLARLLLQRSLA